MSRALLVYAAATVLSAAPAGAAQPSASNWQACTALAADSAARLACFDQWASQQAAPAAPVAATTPPASASTWVQAGVAIPPPPTEGAQAPPVFEIISPEGCRNPAHSDLSRFWELENDTDCGTFSFRGYRPITVSVAKGSSVNRQPSSIADGHTATDSVDFRTTENRIQLSVRTKIAQGLLTPEGGTRKDSLWFGYTQQSYWQLFSGEISRPFRTTDHEPELVYVYPTALNLPAGGRLRFAGLGLVHHSNGQSLPLSRSWNRHYLMAGAEWGPQWQVQARVWKRIAESRAQDDNPDISDLLGRGELRVLWNPNPQHTLGVTVRHALRQSAKGSTRLDWLRTLGEGAPGGKSNLRLHAQLFHGYGDSLIDYNRRRTVFSLGLSLLDF